MLEAVGHPVRRLHRSLYRPGLGVYGLGAGASGELRASEVEQLRRTGPPRS